MSTAWTVIKTAACVVAGVILGWLAFTFGWFPYASDTPAGRRRTKWFFAISFSALAVFFAVEREWELAGAMVGCSALFLVVFLLIDLWIARTDSEDRTRENVRRAAMRRRIAEEQAAARRRPGRLP